jgi:mannose-6-phosphate isomerase-like protein (cupin superfamily)
VRKVYISLIIGLGFGVSCATNTRSHFWRSQDRLTTTRIEDALARHPIAPDENINVITLGATDTVSHHVVQIRHSEELHIHERHDLSAIVYRGAGTMRAGDSVFPVSAGDVLFIPRGVPHAFRNDGVAPAVAIVVFSPSFDGEDTIPWPRKD